MECEGQQGASLSRLGEYDSTDYPFGLPRPDGRAADRSPSASSACTASACSRALALPDDYPRHDRLMDEVLADVLD
jgi:hypothetical protein